MLSNILPQAYRALPGRTTRVVVQDGLFDWDDLLSTFSVEEGFILIRCQERSGDLLSQWQSALPCIVIVEQRLLETIQPARLRQSLDNGRSIRVLVQSADKDSLRMRQLLLCGCAGFLSENCTTGELRSAVDRVDAGEIWASRRLISQALRVSLSTEARKLTSREQQVLSLIARGLTNREMAEALGVSRETVRRHERRIYLKIGVGSRRQAADYYALEGEAA